MPSEFADVKALVLGSSGQLGWQCLKNLPSLGVEVRGLDRSQLDVSKGVRSDWMAVLEGAMKDFRPNWLINAIAYTAVDRAEDEPALAMKVNGEFPEFLANAMRTSWPNSYLLHCSTDYVFDGKGSTPFREVDPTGPLSVYGESKLRGEGAVMSQNDRAWVLRFSWVVGEHGQNFAKTMLRLACERERIRVVGDQYGVPSPTPFLVREFARLMKRCDHDHGLPYPKQRRLFHVVPAGETTWHAYAQACISQAANHRLFSGRLKLSVKDIERIITTDYPTKAVRPMNSRLDCTAWCDWHGMPRLPAWESETIAVINKIIEQSL